MTFRYGTIFVTCLLMLFLVFTIQAQETDVNCDAPLPPRLITGLWGKVLENPPNRLRAAPTEDSDVVGSIPAGHVFRVLGDPICDAITGVNWWQVNYNDTSGWTAEGQADTYWLEPLFSNGDAISPQNANALTQIASFGKGIINDTILAPDGRWLALAADGLGIWMYDLNQPEREPLLFEGRIVGIPMFSADSRFIAAKVCHDWFDAGGGHIGCTDVQVIVWNVVGGRQELIIPNAGGDGVIGTMIISPTDPLLFISAIEGIQVWDIEAKQQRYLIEDNQLIWPNERLLALSGNGQFLMTRLLNETAIQIRDIASGSVERTIDSEQAIELAGGIELNYDASVLLIPAGRSDRETTIIEIETGEILATLDWDIRPAGQHFFLSNGSHIAIKYPDGRAVIWDFTTQTTVQELGTYDRYAFSADSQRYAGVVARNRVDIVNMEDRSIEAQITGLYRLQNLIMFHNRIYALSNTETSSSKPKLWNIASDQVELQLESPYFAISLQGRIVAWDYHPDSIYWRDSADSSALEIPLPANTTFLDVAITENDLRILLRDQNAENRTLILWGVLENRNINRMEYPGRVFLPKLRDYEDHFVHSADGRLVVFGDANNEDFQLWNVETGEFLQSVSRDFHPLFMAISPDATTVAIITCLHTDFNYSCQEYTETELLYKYQTFFWDLEQNTLVQGADIQATFIMEIAFSPDGRLLAIAGCAVNFSSSDFCSQGKFEIWDVERRNPILIQNVYNNIVSHIQFSPDGSVIAVNGFHGLAGLWAIAGD